MFQLKYLLLLTYTIGVLTVEETTEAQERIYGFLRPPPNNNLSNKPALYNYPKQNEEPSFFSRVVGWMFPFGNSNEGNSEQVQQEAQERYAPQYVPGQSHLPPPQLHQTYSQQQQQEQQCNPCDKEPWVPVAATHGQNTVIGFVQQPQLGNQGYPLPQLPPSNNYGPPPSSVQDFHPPPSNQYGQPVSNQYGPPVSNQYGLPVSNQYGLHVSNQYAPPVSNQYGPPPLKPNIHPEYGVPKDQFGHSSNVKQVYAFPLQYMIPPPMKFQNSAKYKHFPQKPNSHNQKPGLPKHNPQFYKQAILKPNLPNIKFNTPAQHGPPIPLNQDKLPSNIPIFTQSPPISIPPILSPDFKPPTISVGDFKSSVLQPNIDYSPVQVSYNQFTNADPSIKPNLLGNPGIKYPNLNHDPSFTDLHFHQPSPHNNLITNIKSESAHEIQIIPSVRIADYVASIEHPINVIQSPIVEVIASDTSQNLETDTGNSYGSNKVQLNQNPVIVNSRDEDTHVAASAQNASYHNLITDQNRNSQTFLNSSNYTTETQFPHNSVTNNDEDKFYKSIFSQPSLDYTNWQPSYGVLSTAMMPPPPAQPIWLNTAPVPQIAVTTKKPKQVQIIIPYVSTHNITGTQVKNPTLPYYTKPPISEPVWSTYVTDHVQDGSDQVTATERFKSTLSNIRDLLLREQTTKDTTKPLPFDIIRLQKTIDDWTQQEYSNGLFNAEKVSTSGKLVPSKKIPSDYLTTKPCSQDILETATVKNSDETIFDHQAAGSNKNLFTTETNEDIENNFIVTETTTGFPTTTESLTTVTLETITPMKASTERNISEVFTVLGSSGRINFPVHISHPMWEKLQLAFSPSTKEKVYVVTPQPWKVLPKEINEKLLSLTEPPKVALTSSKFSVVIQPEGASNTNAITKHGAGGSHIVYSEWPHLINNLVTTTTEKPKLTNPPLLGLMDLTSYTTPSNSTVETYEGHSKVITVVTPSGASKKKNVNFEETTTAKTDLI